MNKQYAENAGFISAASDCLKKDKEDYCYFSIKKEIAANPYYSGKKPVPLVKQKK